MLYEKSKAKDIISDKDRLKEIVSKSIHTMAETVGSTLGPGGRGVLIERDGMSPLVTKDGVTVARSLGVDKAENNIIIEAAKEICVNTAKEAGDGTTTAIILADALIKYGHEFTKTNTKYNPQRVTNELNNLYNKVIVPYLKKNAVPVETEEKLIDVATISANGDKDIAKIVVEAVVAAGDDGKVLIEEGQGSQLEINSVDGFVVTSGLKELGHLGPVFINDKSNQQVLMDRGLVFLYDGTMHDLQVPAAIQEIIEQHSLEGMPLAVFAHDFSDTVIDRFVKSCKGGANVLPIKTPQSGLPNGRSIFLGDMAAYTGGKVYSPANIDEIGNDEVVFGSFTKAKINTYEAFIVNDEANSDAVSGRVKELKSIRETAFSEIDKMHLDKHIGQLTGGVVTILVGGTSDLERKEKKDRVEDAVEAVKSAISEGIIPGGCSVHLVLSELIKTHKDYKESWSIVVNALREPFNRLMDNCGEDSTSVLNSISSHVIGTSELPKKVFDASEYKLVDPFKAGIIEPAKVCRVSIGNALSVASLLMTLGGIVCVPRDAQLENQLAMSKQAFQDMMGAGGGFNG